MGAAELDFVNESFIVDIKDSGILHYTAPDIAPLSLAGVLTPNSTLPVIVVLGVEFYQEVNGEMYPLKNGAFNALAVVLTDTL